MAADSSLDSVVTPYEALLLVSFGGPEKPEDVVPFLRNVTRGRNIPDERLEEVGEHYYSFGGRSPINDQNRAFIEAVRADFDEHGIDLPIYWGNRNWDPYLRETTEQMVADGITRAACFVTSAYSSWSGCRQYRENLYDAVSTPEALPLRLDKLRHYYNHPGFLAANTDAVLAALADLPDDQRSGARLVYVTHSIPTAMDAESGPPERGGGLYVTQHRETARLITEAVVRETGIEHPHDVVFCSRSGPPSMPWLEPDVNDHLTALAGGDDRPSAVVLSPIGFVSDHMEVIYDLDTEAAETAAELDLPMRRAATAGVDPRFVDVVRDLLVERAAAERGEDVARNASGERGASWDVCPARCCGSGRPGSTERPALCGSD